MELRWVASVCDPERVERWVVVVLRRGREMLGADARLEVGGGEEVRVDLVSDF